MWITVSIDNSDYIAHHGIMGQKWGKKNGPPYPLSDDVSTGKRLKNQEDDLESNSRTKLAKSYLKNAKGDPLDYASDDSTEESYAALQKMINEKSGDFYNGKAVSSGFKKVLNKYEALNKKYQNDKTKYNLNSAYRKEVEKIYDEMSEQILKDLDMDVTSKNKKYIKYVWLYD